MAIEKSLWREQNNTAVVGDSKESTQIIERDGSKIDSFVQQNSPVNNEMIRNATMNDLYTTDIDGQMQMIPTVVREKHGKAEPVISYVSFSYDDTVDLEILNKNPSRNFPCQYPSFVITGMRAVLSFCAFRIWS